MLAWSLIPSWVKKGLFLIIVTAFLAWGTSHWWDQTKAQWEKTGYDQAMAEVFQAQQEANEKLRKKKKVIRHETQNMDRDAIVRELCSSGWVRTPANCPK